MLSFDLTSQTETVLYSFAGGTDGSTPGYGSLVQDGQGNLYGTTVYGGSHALGTVYKLNPATGTETVLYSFTGGADGGNPYGGLVIDSQGNLFGTTYEAGYITCAGGGCGTAFELSAAETLTVLHNFSGSDGQQPHSTLVVDSAGNLYGTASAGGANGYGNVFKLAPPARESGR